MPARQKGARLEYKIRDLFSSYLDCKMSRSPSSGAFGTVNRDTTLVGDIYSPDFDIKLCIECKNHNNPSLKQFWEQTETQCPSDKVPVLILHYKRKDYLFTTSEIFDYFEQQNSFKEVEMQKWTAKYLPKENEKVMFMNRFGFELKAFVKSFKPKRSKILGIT